MASSSSGSSGSGSSSSGGGVASGVAGGVAGGGSWVMTPSGRKNLSLEGNAGRQQLLRRPLVPLTTNENIIWDPASPTDGGRRRLPPAEGGHQKEDDKCFRVTTVTVEAIEDHSPRKEGELCVKRGDTIVVIGLHEDGWWAGSVNSRIGTFPSRCIFSPELPLPTHLEKLLQLSEAYREGLSKAAPLTRTKPPTKAINFGQHRHRRRSRSVDTAVLSAHNNSSNNFFYGGGSSCAVVSKAKNSNALSSSYDDSIRSNEEATKARNAHLISPPRTPTITAMSSPILSPSKLFAALEAKKDHDRHKRNNVLNEILTTEQNYVRDLNVLISVFLFPLQATALRPEEEVKLLFSDIEIIANVNQELLKKLEERIVLKKYSRMAGIGTGSKSSDQSHVVDSAEVETAAAVDALHIHDPENGRDNIDAIVDERKTDADIILVGDIFLSMAEALKMYSNYCTNYSNAVNLLDLLESNKDWQSFLAICQSDSKCHALSLSNFLIKPVQRICKYPLLINELMKCTDSAHSEYAMLFKAKEKIEQVVNYINSKKEWSEMLQKAIDIQSDVDGILEGDLVAPSRRFVKEGPMVVSKLSSNGWISKEDAQLFLFNDLIVISKRKGMLELAMSTPSSLANNKHRKNFDLLAKISLDLCRLIDLADSPQAKSAFEIISGAKTWRFFGASEDDKSSWVKCLKGLLKEAQKRKIQELKVGSVNIGETRSAAIQAHPVIISRKLRKGIDGDDSVNIKEMIPITQFRTLRSLKEYISEKHSEKIESIEYLDSQLNEFVLMQTDADAKTLSIQTKKHLRISTKQRRNQITLKYDSLSGIQKQLCFDFASPEELTEEEIQDITSKLTVLFGGI